MPRNEMKGNDPLGFGLKSYPRPLQRLWLILQGNPYFEEDIRKARRELGIQVEGFSKAAPFVQWQVERMHKAGNSMARAATPLMTWHWEKDWPPSSPPMSLTESIGSAAKNDPLYDWGQRLSDRYGITPAEAHLCPTTTPSMPFGMRGLIAFYILFNFWPEIQPLGSVVFSQVRSSVTPGKRPKKLWEKRQTAPKLTARAGTGRNLPIYFSWWKERRDGKTYRQIADYWEELTQGIAVGEDLISKEIAVVEELMRPEK